MKTVRFNYWTDMMRCGCGGNVGGSASVDLTEEEEKTFTKALDPAIETRDMLGYFEDNLPEELATKISTAVYDDFKRITASDIISEVGYEAFNNMSEEEYDSLSEDKLVDRFIEETEASEEGWDFCFVIVDMKIID